MRNKDIERRIRSGAEAVTPDVLNEIFAKCGAATKSLYVIQPRVRRRWARAVGALAAAFVVAFGSLFAAERLGNLRVDALVMLDVNPSIEIQLNKNDRVIDVEAKNEGALVILDRMDLRNTPIDVAINALVGSMLKHGYIRENANSVLLSIEGANDEKNAALRKTLSWSISQQLNEVNGAVISQSLSEDGAIHDLAEAHQISYGKAALVQKIIRENNHLLFEDLAKLSVNELNLLVRSKRIDLAGMDSHGNASESAYIGEESAVRAALVHAGFAQSEVGDLRTEMDYDDGVMVYDIQFSCDGSEYEYEINALDGSVVEYDKERSARRKDGKSPGGQTQNRENFIGKDAAADIAAAHAGVQTPKNLESELDKDDGVYYYEVEFTADGREHGYEINATTGEILSWEVDT